MIENKIDKNKLDESQPLPLIKPNILPDDTIKKEGFFTIRQGTPTNTFTKFRDTKEKTVIDPLTGTATIKNGSFILTIVDYLHLKGLKTSTHQLLDLITIAFTQSGTINPKVKILLSDYMKSRNLKNRKEAKNKVKEDMEVLKHSSITGEEKKGKNTEKYSFINIADSGSIEKNGDIIFTFGSSFFDMLLHCPVMPYPKQLQTINPKRNPNSYYFLRKISEHKNMNIGKKNENILSIKTLLASSGYIPTYEEVIKGNRNIEGRIINPFERDMDALEDLKWEYCHSNGEPLTNQELENLNYNIFINLLVKITWITYPDQTKRLERKKEKQEQKAKLKIKYKRKKKQETLNTLN